jgi:hypothetical protein
MTLLKKITMKIEEMARNVLHFALNIFLLSFSYFEKYLLINVTTVGNQNN